MHSGLAAVGSVLVLGRSSVMFLGDTGNVAARLEAMTKELRCILIVSDAVLDIAGLAVPPAALQELQIRGREGQSCRGLTLRSPAEAQSLIPFAELAAAGRPRRGSRRGRQHRYRRLLSSASPRRRNPSCADVQIRNPSHCPGTDVETARLIDGEASEGHGRIDLAIAGEIRLQRGPPIAGRAVAVGPAQLRDAGLASPRASRHRRRGS